jgi:hypothetical protein
MQRVEDSEEIIERVAAIDVGKAEVVVCIRIPDPARAGRRQQGAVGRSILVIIWQLLSSPRPATTTWARTTPAAAPTPTSPPATTSSNSKPSATTSPSHPSPNQTPNHHGRDQLPVRPRSPLPVPD